MNELQIHFEGERAADTAADFSRTYRALFGEEPQPASATPPLRPQSTQRSVELALGIAGILLALPSALKDYGDLAERLKLGEKLRRLKEWLARERRERGTAIRLVARDGRTYDFDRLEPDELLALFSDRS